MFGDLPELVAIICEYLYDPTSFQYQSGLYNALQVNKLWFQEATRILWRGTAYGYHVEFLCQVEDPSHREYYASLMEAVCIRGPLPPQKLNVKFLKLKCLRLIGQVIPERAPDAALNTLMPFFADNLELFHLDCVHFTPHVLFKLAKSCPNITDLSLCYPNDVIAVYSLMEYLKQHAPRKLRIYNYYIPRPLEREFLRVLANVVEIQILDFGGSCDSLVETILKLNDKPFTSVRDLTLRKRGTSFVQNLLVFEALSKLRLKRLKMYFSSGFKTMFTGIASSCPELTHLTLSVQREEEFNQSDFIQMGKCLSKLTHLLLVLPNDDYMSPEKITGNLVLNFVNNTPQLEVLNMNFINNFYVSFETVLEIGRRCENLRKLLIPITNTRVNKRVLDQLPTENCIFPHLTTISWIPKHGHLDRVNDEMFSKHFPHITWWFW